MTMQLGRARGARPRFGSPGAAGAPATSALRRQYGEYCQRQAVGLVELMPREGVRPLYRQAREWAVRQGVHDSQDPMATLHRFCRELLPLPSFAVWLVDYESHRLAHLKAGVAYPHAGEPSEPVTVEFREVEHASDRWQASLDVYRDQDLWRGYIRFHRGSAEVHVRNSWFRPKTYIHKLLCDNMLRDLVGHTTISEKACVSRKRPVYWSRLEKIIRPSG